MRSAALFDQPQREGGRGQRGDPDRRTRAANPDWFLHDDRDMPPRSVALERAEVSPSTARSWEYKDLDGKTHGPFSSEKMKQWASKGYFQQDLQVRQTGASRWTILSQVQSQMSEQTAVQSQRPLAENPRTSAFDRLGSDSRVGVHSSHGTRRGSGRDSGDNAGRGGRGQGRGNAAEDRRPKQRAGRGGGGSAARTRGASLKVAQARRLFTNKAALAADQPMWRYIDLSGNIQGPFTAANMIEWYQRGYLGDDKLLLLGHDRQVAPPNLPPLKFYRPLGELLQEGEHYVPMTPEGIKRVLEPSAAGSGADAGSAQAGTSTANREPGNETHGVSSPRELCASMTGEATASSGQGFAGSGVVQTLAASTVEGSSTLLPTQTITEIAPSASHVEQAQPQPPADASVSADVVCHSNEDALDAANAASPAGVSAPPDVGSPVVASASGGVQESTAAQGHSIPATTAANVREDTSDSAAEAEQPTEIFAAFMPEEGDSSKKVVPIRQAEDPASVPEQGGSKVGSCELPT